MTFLHQVRLLFLAHLRVWWRNPRHALVCILLSVTFLIISDHLFVVWLGKHMTIGLQAPNDRVARTIANEFSDAGLTPVRYSSYEDGCYNLVRGSIVGFVSVQTSPVERVNLVFGGRNPLLDRELASILLNVAVKTSDAVGQDMNINLVNNRYSTETMSVFMAAGVLPFLIMILASINCGLVWRHDWEYATLYSFLVTPARRGTQVLARILGGTVITYGILLVSFLLCRPFVSWPWPAHYISWLALVLLVVIFCCCLFFCIATLTRGSMLYDDITYMAVLLLMFISGVLVPVETMPPWEQFVACLTPTFYAVRVLRAVMTDFVPFVLKDIIILAVWSAGTSAVGLVLFSSATIDRQ